MANMIPSFLSSAKLAIHIGDYRIAYAQSLSFSDRMSVAPVGGVGSYNADALEPLQYSVGGSFVVTIYDEKTWKAIEALSAADKKYLPDRATSHTERTGSRGNSLLSVNSFSPMHLMISRTFDIYVYEKASIDGTYLTTPTYHIQDCRLNSYSLAFTPGSLLQENVGFIGMKMVDVMSSSSVINTKETRTTTVP